MRILVTGLTGFVGGHLAEALLTAGGVEIHGLGRQGQWPSESRRLSDKTRLWSGDLLDGPRVLACLKEIQPERIYHLAGYAHVGKSLHEADLAWEGNLTATRRLYEAVLQWGGRPRILYVGSGLVYGEPGTPGQAHDEDGTLQPASPYASSKAAADLVSYEFTRASGLDIVRARAFNHIGPRQAPAYAVAHFAQQIAAIENRRQPAVLETGNLEPQRDLTDVRDIVQAYLLLMERGRTGEVYNVASGAAHSMRSVLDRLLTLARVPLEVRQRDNLVRATETAVVRGNTAKLRRETGWAPRYSLEQTLKDTLDYWREIEKKSEARSQKSE